MDRPPARPRALLAAQCIGVVLAFVMLALMPPAKGPMLLVPLDGRAATAINPALARGALLLGRGRLPGSVAVEGRRAALLGPLLAAGILVLAATPALCGDVRARGALA